MDVEQNYHEESTNSELSEYESKPIISDKKEIEIII